MNARGALRMADVFVSYKAEDRARVVPLVRALEQDGFTIWWDAHIGAGDQWRETIVQHLEAARCVIVVWSRRSVGPEGEFVRDEATRAKRRKAYFPIRIDKVEPPLGFGETQALDLSGWKGDRSNARYQAILSALRSRLEVDSRPNGNVLGQPAVSRRAALAGGVVGVAAVAGAGSWFLLRPSAARSESIAVLPFANLSGDPGQAYFSDGIAEELRNALAKIPGLKVVARTSSEAVRNDDVATAAAKLHVRNILTGSVRRSPQLVRISAQLIDGRDGTEHWSEVYDRPAGDALQIQSDIALKVTNALAVQLAPATAHRLVVAGTNNPKAHDLFLKGVAVRQSGHTSDNLQQAIRLLDAAIQADPNYADAYAMKAITLAELTAGFANSASEMKSGYADADAAARRAIALSPEAAYGHAALGSVLAGQLQFRAADAEFRRSVSQNGADAVILTDYGRFLAFLGKTAPAISLGRRAVAIDPLNARSYSIEAVALFYGRRYAQSAEASLKMLSLAPDSRPASIMRGDSLLQLGKYSEARAAYSKVPADDAFRLTSEGILDERQGNHAASAAAVHRIEQLYGAAASYQLAELHAQRGEAGPAIAALEQGLKARDPGLGAIPADPFLDPIRSDARFKDLVRRLDFPT
jgi:serine/threonine-protein kinase